MRLKADFVELANGDLTASDRYLVEILGGIEAVQALHEDEFENNGGDEDGPEQKRKSHSYNPIHSDGLHDFVGIGYVVDEVIRTRFSIFPEDPVAIGGSWERTLMLSDGIDPTVRAEVNEKYKLLSIFKYEGGMANPGIAKGDLIAEILVNAKERPAPREETKKKNQLLPVNPDPKEEEEEDAEDESKKITPQFARPSFRGHEFSTDGVLKVHVDTGLVITGETTSEASSERTVVVINKKTKKRKTLKAKVDIVAQTTYSGSVN